MCKLEPTLLEKRPERRDGHWTKPSRNLDIPHIQPPLILRGTSLCPHVGFFFTSGAGHHGYHTRLETGGTHCARTGSSSIGIFSHLLPTRTAGRGQSRFETRMLPGDPFPWLSDYFLESLFQAFGTWPGTAERLKDSSLTTTICERHPPVGHGSSKPAPPRCA